MDSKSTSTRLPAVPKSRRVLGQENKADVTTALATKKATAATTAASTAPPPSAVKDMRGLTAIRKSEAALREERELLASQNATLQSQLSELSQQFTTEVNNLQQQIDTLAADKQKKQEAFSEYRKQTAAAHQEAMASAEQEFKTRLSEVEAKLQALQTAVESAGLSAVTMKRLPQSDKVQDLQHTMATQTAALTQELDQAITRAEQMTAESFQTIARFGLVTSL